LVELRVVVPAVAGSSPVAHPWEGAGNRRVLVSRARRLEPGGVQAGAISRNSVPRVRSETRGHHCSRRAGAQKEALRKSVWRKSRRRWVGAMTAPWVRPSRWNAVDLTPNRGRPRDGDGESGARVWAGCGRRCFADPTRRGTVTSPLRWRASGRRERESARQAVRRESDCRA